MLNPRREKNSSSHRKVSWGIVVRISLRNDIIQNRRGLCGFSCRYVKPQKGDGRREKTENSISAPIAVQSLQIDQFRDDSVLVAERLECGQLAAALGCPETPEKAPANRAHSKRFASSVTALLRRVSVVCMYTSLPAVLYGQALLGVFDLADTN